MGYDEAIGKQMDDDEPSVTLSPITGGLRGEVVVSLQPEGVLVGGDDEAVDSYLQRIRTATSDAIHVVAIDTASIGAATGLLTGVTSVLGQSGKFVQLHPDSLKAIRAGNLIPGDSADYYRMMTTGADGKFVKQLQWRHANVASSRLMSAQMLAVQFALKAAINEVEKAVKRVESKVEDVLRLAQANRAGDVLGDRVTVDRMVTYLEKHGSLADADWDSIASIGPSLVRTVEQLRNHAQRTLKAFDATLPIRERAGLINKAVANDNLGETLSLLVVTQDSLYKWQRLRLARVESTQPEHLQKVLDDARDLLARQMSEDGELYQRARDVLDAVASTKTSDGLAFWAVDGLNRDLPALRADLDAFARARKTQAEDWKDFYAPQFLEAASAALETAADTAGRALNAAGTGVSKIGGFVSRRVRRPATKPAKDEPGADEPAG
ncbi:hypothetical protein [Mycolicibacterium mengxianglii]|uniref:hypothetical protein n=1 Tax=Mycolicibacterium mengxianglii TaxID=2736649 RepID=UPI0018D057B0|nr:hypothetical protein [Mycolicibacterium mengxianglii]